MRFKKIRNKKKFVEVHWVDSVSSGQWKSIDGIKKFSSKEFRIVTKGFLIMKNKKVVTIASSIGEDNTYISMIGIPRGCIKKIKFLN
ncbi:hypothetical protein A2Z67_02380 [Candidatus Woesebacteria bacterium RBG_13_36_22]|uniref:Uncharacterized protein n=1 Tax=Candidatus Woesebacteria bacterium RBG_13_36_22 TaxID=1802478 RepID=A0A1F7X1I4_9BACT|nr:MAG: hypothetical protein A2Z67_02380 [Candidatus Woesebacteria bacterium RBG_13_36_22]